MILILITMTSYYHEAQFALKVGLYGNEEALTLFLSHDLLSGTLTYEFISFHDQACDSVHAVSIRAMGQFQTPRKRSIFWWRVFKKEN